MLKVRQALRAMSVLMRDPFEFVALNEMTDAVSLWWPVQRWYRGLLKDVPQSTLDHLRELTRRPVDVEALARLPENTFGHRFVAFMSANGIVYEGHVSAVPDLVETFERDWVTQRFFKIHDILHLVVGFDASVPGEMGLQMFDAANLREPYGFFAVLSAPYMMLHYGQPVRMVREIIRGYTVGGATENLFFAPFEEMWEWDLDDVRAYLGLGPPGRPSSRSPRSLSAKPRGQVAPPPG
jgi:ubiquinone biosynthesis protein Coq4